MKTSYYITQAGQQSGPFTEGQLRSMWDLGQLTKDAVCWCEGMSDWQPVENLTKTAVKKSAISIQTLCILAGVGLFILGGAVIFLLAFGHIFLRT